MELVESFYYAARSGGGWCACVLLSETVEDVRRRAKIFTRGPIALGFPFSGLSGDVNTRVKRQEKNEKN